MMVMAMMLKAMMVIAIVMVAMLIMLLMAMLVLLNNADHDKEEDRQHKRNVHGGSHEPHASTRRMQSASRKP